MKKTYNNQVILLGSYPPPYGGVSIHIQRLKEKLDETNIKSIVYDFSPNDIKNNLPDIIEVNNPIKLLIKFIFIDNKIIIHSHFSNWLLRSIFCLLGLLNKKTIITIHGESLKKSLEENNWVKKFTIKFAIKKASYIIVMNNDIKQLCLDLGVIQSRLELIPSFIPPKIQSKEINVISNTIWDFIDDHSPLISANAFMIKFHNNKDLYGLDMCIELCKNLVKDYPKIGFIFCLPMIGDERYYLELKKQIIENHIENNFLFVNESHQFYPILMKSDIFVRPTDTDGDAISIREAIYFKIPVVTSDCVDRPKTTILFKNRDIDDFTRKVKYVLKNFDSCKKELTELNNIDENFEKIFNIYSKLS